MPGRGLCAVIAATSAVGRRAAYGEIGAENPAADGQESGEGKPRPTTRPG